MKNMHKQALDAFKKIISMVGDPMPFYHYGDPEPACLRQLPLGKDVKEMLFKTFCKRLEAEEPLIDCTVVEQDITRLAI